MKEVNSKPTRITINHKPIETHLPATKPSQIVHASGTCFLLTPVFLIFDSLSVIDGIVSFLHFLTNGLYLILYSLLLMIIFKGSWLLYHRWKNHKGRDENGVD